LLTLLVSSQIPTDFVFEAAGENIVLFNHQTGARRVNSMHSPDSIDNWDIAISRILTSDYASTYYQLEFFIIDCAFTSFLDKDCSDICIGIASFDASYWFCGSGFYNYYISQDQTVMYDYGIGIFRQGDYITLDLDLLDRTITWSINGIKGAQIPIMEANYFFQVWLLREEDSVQILPKFCAALSDDPDAMMMAETMGNENKTFSLDQFDDESNTHY